MKKSEQAWCVREWAVRHRTQTDIARELGYKSSAIVAVAIAEFCDCKGKRIYNGERAAIAAQLLDDYEGIIIRPKPCVNYHASPYYSEARHEHAFMLRAEGLHYAEIGRRLGVGRQRAFTMVARAARRLKGAMHSTRWQFYEHIPFSMRADHGPR
jgi:hypothetical protein